jgi:manganese oxidase
MILLIFLPLLLFNCEMSREPFSLAGKNYVAPGKVSVITPNVKNLPYQMKNGVKVFHLIAQPVKQEFADGLVANTWGYNGSSPGPTIEAVEGDRVRILVENRLKEPTTIHWHGIMVPNSEDGVAGLNQAPIQPGEIFAYEFSLNQHGTYMYHPHFDETIQVAMGMMGFFIIHPKESESEPVDRDFAIFAHEWFIPVGASTPDPMRMSDFNYFTFNGRVYPGTDPLVVKTGERVRIRFANLSSQDHPFHLHGYAFTVTAQGGWKLPPSAQYLGTTIDVNVGDTNDIEFVADKEGDWALHCHKNHHIMNGMVHNIPNMIGVDPSPIVERIKNIFPDYMPMGTTGMGDMFDEEHHHMKRPSNYLPFGSPGPFGTIQMGGMFTIIKVRNGLDSYEDPGWFKTN